MGVIKADIHQINCNYKMLENDYRNIIGWTPYAIPRKGNTGIQKINPLKIKSFEAYTSSTSLVLVISKVIILRVVRTDMVLAQRGINYAA